jgi:hypothetical protein
MKPSEIKVGETYVCKNGDYRQPLFFWPSKDLTDLAYAKWVKNKRGRRVRKTWIGGNCTIKHFARYATSKAPKSRVKR